MSIITRTSVFVIPMVVEKTKYGTYKRIRGEQVEVKGVTVQPFNAGTVGNLEAPEEDEVPKDQFTIKGHNTVWPGGTHSIVVYNGQEYDQVGGVKYFRIGQFTKHWQIRIKGRTAEVK